MRAEEHARLIFVNDRLKKCDQAVMHRRRFNGLARVVSLNNGFVLQGRLDGPCGQPAVLQERVDNVDCGW